MDVNQSDILSTSLCPGSDALRAYQNGALSDKQTRFVELHLADCEMCSDELEGMAIIESEEMEQRLGVVGQKFYAELLKSEKKRIPLWPRLLVAASVLVLFGLMFWLKSERIIQPNTQLAQEIKESEKKDQTPQTKIEQPVGDANSIEESSSEKQKQVVAAPSVSAHVPDKMLENEYATSSAVVSESSGEIAKSSSDDINFKEENKKQDVVVNEKPVVNSQNRLVGVVKDNVGISLPGVSVAIKGTTQGTITDMDGKFSLDISGKADPTLKINFIGYDPLEIKAKNTKDTLAIALTESAIALDEVVVVGYGTVKKSNVTGSVTSVNSKDFNKPKDPKQIVLEEISTAKQMEFHQLFDSALVHYKKVVKIEPNHVKAQLSLIYCYLKLDRTAIAEYKIDELFHLKAFETLKLNLQNVRKLIEEEEYKKAMQMVNQMRH